MKSLSFDNHTIEWALCVLIYLTFPTTLIDRYYLYLLHKLGQKRVKHFSQCHLAGMVENGNTFGSKSHILKLYSITESKYNKTSTYFKECLKL